MRINLKFKLPALPILAALFLTCLLLSGCLPIHQYSVRPTSFSANSVPSTNDPTRFNGLATQLTEAATNGCTLRLLVVHGMGIQNPGYSTGLVNSVASQLNVNFVSESSQTNYHGHDYSVLTIRNFASGHARLCVYELTWSPITRPIKASQFYLDYQMPLVMSRQIINNDLKTNLIDNALSDVVLYVGQYRPHLQRPIIDAITNMVSDSGTNNDPIAILTHSLASYMVIDTLKTMADQTTAQKYAAHVNQIFMLANQLPILELSDRTNFDVPSPGIMAGFFKLREDGHQHHMRNKPRHALEIVAFSDPNDLLSFALRQPDIDDGMHTGITVHGFNVKYTDEHWSILGIVSSPENAHVNWWTDFRVPGFLANGLDTTAAEAP